MSYTYLQAQGAESSAESFADIPQSVLLKLNPIADRSCCNGNGMGSCQCSQSGTMLPPSMGTPGVEGLIWLPVDSHARTFPRLGRVRELMAKGPACGEKWQGLSVRLNPDMCGWRTHRCLFIEDCPESSVILPGWGLMQGGEFWGLMMPGHPTEEKGSGSLVTFPTPKASEDKCGTDSSGTPSLGKMALDGLWPTPMAQDADKATTRLRDNFAKGGNLTAAVANWPTPTASQHKGWAANHNRADTDDRLDYTVEREANQNQPGDKARLNPDWVEWLMGWPIGWTSLEPLNLQPIWHECPEECGDFACEIHRQHTGECECEPIEWWVEQYGVGPYELHFCGGWTHDPGETGEVPRAAHKIKSRVARLKAIGNGQVPQVVNLAWWILSAGIVESCN